MPFVTPDTHQSLGVIIGSSGQSAEEGRDETSTQSKREVKNRMKFGLLPIALALVALAAFSPVVSAASTAAQGRDSRH